MNKWKEVKLGQISPFKYGKSKVAKDRVKGEFSVYSSGGHCGYSNDVIANKGIIIGRKGSVGTLYYSDKPFFCIDTTFFIDETEEDSSLKFIYYFLKTLKLDQYNNDAAVPGLNRNLAHNLKVQIPNLETQEKVANILTTYDELIEINNRRIEIIEKSAEEIYKEWFVRMRFPGYEKAVFEKGIPQGWEVVEISEIIGIADGTHDTPKKTNIGVPLVTGKNIANGSIDFNSTYNISLEDFKKINIRSAIYKNDILYSNIGTIGLMTLVNEDNKYSVKNLIILKTSEYDFYEYIYLLFSSKSSQYFFESVANGASQKFISLTEMRNHKILLPCSKLLAEFKLNVKELFKESKILKAQNQNLIKQRDMLLPRLMNGTIEVK